MISMWAALPPSDKMEAIVSLLGVLVTALALVFAGLQFKRGVAQYRHEQTWRRKEYVAREHDRLVADPKAALALQMLDWDARSLPLLQGKEGEPIMVRVDRRMFGRALIPHTIGSKPAWGEAETAIRDCMDALLGRLSTFETMIAEELIKQTDIAPYLAYWVRLIGDKNSRSSPEAIRNLWLYIHEYEFSRAAAFIERFGYRIDPTEGDRKALERECAEGRWSDPVKADVPPTKQADSLGPSSGPAVT